MAKRTNLILLLGVLWLCCVCSTGYFSLANPGIGTRWKREPAPPEALSRLATGNDGEIIGHAPSRAMYEFDYGAYQSASSWKKVSGPSGVPVIGANCTAGDSNRIMLPPPGKVTSRVNENCVYIESAYHLEVALLENGEVWSWEHESYIYTELFVIFFLGIAFIIGVLIIVIGAGVIVYKKLKGSSKEK